MDSMLYLVGTRMNGLAEGLEVTAANLANANTPGYKRMQSSFRSVLQSSMAAGGTSAVAPEVALQWPSVSGHQIDVSQGPTSRTGRPLDVAVRGKGFLVLDTIAGERYTRKGRMYLNSQGELTDAAGNRFAADSGSLRIPDPTGEIAISPDGEVTVDGQSVGKLKLVDIPRSDALVPEGAGVYRNEGPSATAAVGSEIEQGAVEESNVQPMQEMVALVQLMRAYESGTRMMKRWDSVKEKLIQSAA